MNSVRTFLYTRRSAFFAVALLAAAFLAAGMHGRLNRIWSFYDYPALSPTFADTRTVTHSIDCVARGIDPFVAGTCDPWGRLYNYPPIWLQLGRFGISSHSSNWLGCLLALFLLASVLVVQRARSWSNALILLASLISFPVLFAVERGNIDGAVFFLLVFGLLLTHRLPQTKRNFAQAALIVVLTVLKVYPVAAAVVFLRRTRGLVWSVATSAVAILALLATAGRRLFMALANTPQVSWKSFGSYLLAVFVLPHLGLHPSVARVKLFGQIAAALLGLALIWAARSREPLQDWLPQLRGNDARGTIALACLGIYCFVFLLGASWAYRLIFLLPVLGVLLDDCVRRTRFSYRVIALVLVAFFWSFHTPRMALIYILNIIVFAGASFWLAASLLAPSGSPDNLPERAS